jgi:hypothetical protein
MLISIYQDRNGTIWLGSENDGVYKNTGNTFKKFVPLQYNIFINFFSFDCRKYPIYEALFSSISS